MEHRGCAQGYPHAGDNYICVIVHSVNNPVNNSGQRFFSDLLAVLHGIPGVFTQGCGNYRQRVVMRKPINAIPNPTTMFHDSSAGIGRAPWLT